MLVGRVQSGGDGYDQNTLYMLLKFSEKKIHVLKNFKNYHDREKASDVSRERSYSVTDIGFVSTFYT